MITEQTSLEEKHTLKIVILPRKHSHYLITFNARNKIVKKNQTFWGAVRGNKKALWERSVQMSERLYPWREERKQPAAILDNE